MASLVAGLAGYIVGDLIAGLKYAARLRAFRRKTIASYKDLNEQLAAARAAIRKATGE